MDSTSTDVSTSNRHLRGFLAGGGLKHKAAYGVTNDEIGATMVEHPVSIAEFHATLHTAMGISSLKNSMKLGDLFRLQTAER